MRHTETVPKLDSSLNGTADVVVAPPPETEIAPPYQFRNLSLTILAVLAVVVVLRYAQSFFVPIVIALLIAYALNPFVILLERARLNRTVAATVVVLALFGVLGLGVVFLRQQAIVVFSSVPEGIAKVRGEIQRYRNSPVPTTSAIGTLQQTATEIEKTASAASNSPDTGGVPKVQIEQPAFRANDFIWNSSRGLFEGVADAVMISFLVFFLLASGDLFKRKLVHLIGTKISEKRITLETLNEMTSQIERFLLIQVFTSIAVGICTAIALWALGLHQAAIWGLAAGALSSVPYIGPLFFTVVVVLAAFVQFGSVGIASKFLVVPAVIFSLEGFLIKPAVMGKAARINSVAMFVSLLFWSWMWGLVGVVVATPIMMVMKCICDRVESLRPIGEILGENASIHPD